MMRMLATLGLALVLLVSSGCALSEMGGGRIREVDMRSVPDGTFIGSASYSIGTLMVQTTVRRHRIVSIRLLGAAMTRGEIRAKEVIPVVIARQTPKVAVIRGAEAESRALLKAIENSLQEGAKRRGFESDLKADRQRIIRQELGY